MPLMRSRLCARVYCGTIGFDYAHVHSPEEREWLYQTAESGRFRDSAEDMNEVKLLERLTQVEAFELFLQRMYPGKTRFSIEGLDMMIPMLDEVIASAARSPDLCHPHRHGPPWTIERACSHP